MIAVATIAWMLLCAASTTFANPANRSADDAAVPATAAVNQPFPNVPTRAESAGAMFMVGLVFGMVSGITLFFIHLRRREQHLARFSPDDLMLDHWPAATDAPSWPSPSSAAPSWDSESSDEMIEKSEPWERSVDWWKNTDDQ